MQSYHQPRPFQKQIWQQQYQIPWQYQFQLFFKAGASLTPSPVMAETSFMDCKYSTILDLWKGSTRANILALAQAARCSETLRSSNSRPEKASPSVDSFSPKIPILLQMASAVFLLSPVIIITRIPASLHRAMEGLTSILGGSNIPTTPTKVKSCSYWANLVESSRSIVLGFMGASQVAKAKQRRVSLPVP